MDDNIRRDLISVIVPVYNTEKYLSRCIESVLNQTYKAFELILVDDGSTDKSPHICDDYAAKDRRIKVMHQENQGVSSARNKGLDCAKGKYITFVDSDDYIVPEFIEKMHDVMTNNDVEICVCDFFQFASDIMPEVYKQEEIKIHTGREACFFQYSNRSIKFIAPWGKLYRKKCFDHIAYPVGRIHEDEFITYKLLYQANQIAEIDNKLYGYYINPKGIMRSKFSLTKYDIVEAIDEKEKYFMKNNEQELVKLCEKKRDLAIAMLGIRARKEKVYKSIFPKYRVGFIESVKILQKNMSNDEYEAFLYDYYPHLVICQSYIKKIKDVFGRFCRKCVDWGKSHFITFKSIYLYIKERRLSFQDGLSIVCIAKNEGRYIEEWVRYYLIQEVDRIYIYDNESPDNMHEILKPYIESGKVIYNYFPGRGKQLAAYSDAIMKYRYKTKYMAFIDVDEFIVQENNSQSLYCAVESIMKKNKRAGGVAVNWRMYGSGGHEKRTSGLVTERFVFRGDTDARGNDCIKTIANPRYIEKYEHDHYPTYILGFNNINEEGQVVLGWKNILKDTKILRINHYFTKSKEEWIERRSKGKADTLNEQDKRTINEFYEHDKNDIYDDIILQYIGRIDEVKDGLS